jgi:YfiH family protein
MIQKTINALSIMFFENLLRYEGIGHFVSTRTGGQSHAPYDSLNLSFDVGDDAEKVLRDRQLIAETLSMPLTSLTTAKQIHDGHVKVVSGEMRGKGCVDYEGAINATDAMVSNVQNTCLAILLADCVPILFYDPSKGAIGVAHAGWRGTLRFVAENTVKALQKHFGCLPQDIAVGIGPSIGPCCYEVGQDVVSEVERAFGSAEGFVRKGSRDGNGYFDLWGANLQQLLRTGIPEENIEAARICTCHHPKLFFSYRHEKGKTGRFGAGIFIR